MVNQWWCLYVLIPNPPTFHHASLGTLATILIQIPYPRALRSEAVPGAGSPITSASDTSQGIIADDGEGSRMEKRDSLAVFMLLVLYRWRRF